MAPPNNWIRTAERTWEAFPAPAGRSTLDLVFDPLPLKGLGAHLETMAPGGVGCPLHFHALEEEHLYVLEGTLSVRERAPGEAHDREFSVHAGELVAWPAGTGIAHQISNRGSAPVRYLAMSDNAPTEIATYPESGKVLLRGLGVGLFTPRGMPLPEPEAAFAATRAAARPRMTLADDERPPHVVSSAQVAEAAWGPFGALCRQLSRTAGARSVFANIQRLPPGAQSSRLHAHLADEELVFVLAGAPTLRQVPGRRDAQRRLHFDGEEARLELAPGDVVHWAPGDLIAHQLLNEGAEDAVVLTIGTDHRHDLCLYPETGEVLSGVLDAVGTLTLTDYWADET